MDTLIQNGIALILAVQSWGGWLTAPMKLFSYLGTEDFFLLALPLIYWSIDSRLGLRVGLILLTGDAFNYTFKLLFAGPRPFWVSSHVKALWPETSFGIPSGHAQHAASIWGMVASYYHKRAAWVAAGLLIFLIGFSRVYLGAHFFHDVLGGWLIGGVLLFFFVRYWDSAADWLAGRSMIQQAGMAFAASLLMIAIGFSAVLLRRNFAVPEPWAANASLAGIESLDPIDPNGIFTSAGTLFGLGFGAAWILRHGGWQVSGPVAKRALRYALGLAGILILWMGLGELFPRGEEFIFYLLRYIRYALVGWWVAGGAPWLFRRVKLS